MGLNYASAPDRGDGPVRRQAAYARSRSLPGRGPAPGSPPWCRAAWIAGDRRRDRRDREAPSRQRRPGRQLADLDVAVGDLRTFGLEQDLSSGQRDIAGRIRGIGLQEVRPAVVDLPVDHVRRAAAAHPDLDLVPAGHLEHLAPLDPGDGLAAPDGDRHATLLRGLVGLGPRRDPRADAGEHGEDVAGVLLLDLAFDASGPDLVLADEVIDQPGIARGPHPIAELLLAPSVLEAEVVVLKLAIRGDIAERGRGPRRRILVHVDHGVVDLDDLLRVIALLVPDERVPAGQVAAVE